LRSRLDEVGDPELGEARDSTCDENAVHELEYAGVCGRSLGLWHHFLFTWILLSGIAVAKVYLYFFQDVARFAKLRANSEVRMVPKLRLTRT
jgi:hypothetical protein